MKFTNMIAIVAMLGVGSVIHAQNEDAQVINVDANSPTAQAKPQPTTVVEAPPASESKADSIRKQRQGQEVQTEQKIVEKLEDSRMQDEKSRADKLFGNKLDNQQPAAQTQQAPPPQPVYTPPAQQQPSIEKVEIVPDRNDDGEKRGKSRYADNDKFEENHENRFYVEGLLGNNSYTCHERPY